MTVAQRLTGLRVDAAGTGSAGRRFARRCRGAVDLPAMGVDGVDRPLRARMRAGQLPGGLRGVFVSVDPQDVIVFEGREGTGRPRRSRRHPGRCGATGGDGRDALAEGLQPFVVDKAPEALAGFVA